MNVNYDVATIQALFSWVPLLLYFRKQETLVDFSVGSIFCTNLNLIFLRSFFTLLHYVT